MSDEFVFGHKRGTSQSFDSALPDFLPPAPPPDYDESAMADACREHKQNFSPRGPPTSVAIMTAKYESQNTPTRTHNVRQRVLSDQSLVPDRGMIDMPRGLKKSVSVGTSPSNRVVVHRPPSPPTQSNGASSPISPGSPGRPTFKLKVRSPTDKLRLLKNGGGSNSSPTSPTAHFPPPPPDPPDPPEERSRPSYQPGMSAPMRAFRRNSKNSASRGRLRGLRRSITAPSKKGENAPSLLQYALSPTSPKRRQDKGKLLSPRLNQGHQQSNSTKGHMLSPKITKSQSHSPSRRSPPHSPPRSIHSSLDDPPGQPLIPAPPPPPSSNPPLIVMPERRSRPKKKSNERHMRSLSSDSKTRHGYTGNIDMTYFDFATNVRTSFPPVKPRSKFPRQHSVADLDPVHASVLQNAQYDPRFASVPRHHRNSPLPSAKRKISREEVDALMESIYTEHDITAEPPATFGDSTGSNPLLQALDKIGVDPTIVDEESKHAPNPKSRRTRSGAYQAIEGDMSNFSLREYLEKEDQRPITDVFMKFQNDYDGDSDDESVFGFDDTDDDKSDDENIASEKSQSVENLKKLLDNHPHINNFVNKSIKKYRVTKRNKYNRQSQRLVTCDTRTCTIRLLDLEFITKKEFPARHIHMLKLHGSPEGRRCRMQMAWEDGPPFIDLTFETATEYKEFGEQVASARRISRATNRASASTSMGQPRRVAPSPYSKDSYDQYTIIKLNRFGRKQQRFFVINSMRKLLLVLDTKRNCKKEINASEIVSIEVVSGKQDVLEDGIGEEDDLDNCRAHLVFLNGRRPFVVYFQEEELRTRFCEQMRELNPDIFVKDDGDAIVEDGSNMSFNVLKISKKLGLKQKRAVFLDFENKVIRSHHVGRKTKDIPVERVTLLQKSSKDKLRLDLDFEGDIDPETLIFCNPRAREIFVGRLHTMRYPNFSDRQVELKVFVGSWNLGNSPPTGEPLQEWIPVNEHDIFVIGFQECSKNYRENWVKYITAHINQQWSDDVAESSQKYLCLHVAYMWEIVIFLVVRRDLVPMFSHLEDASVATGVGDMLGNKGGVALAFHIDQTSFCFLCSHLAARAERLEQRRQNFIKIVREIQIGENKDVDILNNFSHVVWFGDLNYRIKKPFNEVIDIIEQRNYSVLWTFDQLKEERQTGSVFFGFEEGKLAFAPTYRMKKDEPGYSNKRDQPPSYTDRCLWKSMPDCDDFRQTYNSSAPGVLGSDHRPIKSTFEFKPLHPCTNFDSDNTETCCITLTNLSMECPEYAEDGAIMQLRFTCEYIAQPEISGIANFDGRKLCWFFDDEQLPALMPFISDEVFLENIHLIVHVRATVNDSTHHIGSGAIALRQSFSPSPTTFRTSFTKYGMKVGIIRGHIHSRRLKISSTLAL